MDIRVKETVPGLREANRLLSDIKKLGIEDVEPIYDAQVKLWAIAQVFTPSNRILLMNTSQSRTTQPIVMWWCRTEDLKFRTPNQSDLLDIITTVKRAQVWFDKGSDTMIDRIEEQEKKDYDKRRQEQSEKIRSVAKPLKKAIKKELG